MFLLLKSNEVQGVVFVCVRMKNRWYGFVLSCIFLKRRIGKHRINFCWVLEMKNWRLSLTEKSPVMSLNKTCTEETRLSTASLVLWPEINSWCYWIYKQKSCPPCHSCFSVYSNSLIVSFSLKKRLTDSLGNKYLCDCLCSHVWTTAVCSVQRSQFAERCTKCVEGDISLVFFFQSNWLPVTAKCIRSELRPDIGQIRQLSEASN